MTAFGPSGARWDARRARSVASAADLALNALATRGQKRGQVHLLCRRRRASECAQDTRPLFGAPCAAVRRGRSGTQGNRQGCRFLFAGTGVPSKSPATPHGLAGQDARRAPSGVAFSLLRASCPAPFGPASPFAQLLRHSGLLSLATQRKRSSDSGSGGARNLLTSDRHQNKQGIATEVASTKAPTNR